MVSLIWSNSATAQMNKPCQPFSYWLRQNGQCWDLTALSRQGDADRWKLIATDVKRQSRLYIKPSTQIMKADRKIAIRSRQVWNARSHSIQGSEFQVTIDCRKKTGSTVFIASFNMMGQSLNLDQESVIAANALAQGKLDSTLASMISRQIHRTPINALKTGMTPIPNQPIDASIDLAPIYPFVCQ